MMGLGGHLAPPGSDFYAVCLIFGVRSGAQTWGGRCFALTQRALPEVVIMEFSE